MSREWMAGDEELVDETSADQMLLDDTLEDGWIALRIPRALGIDHGDRPPLADAQAVGFRAQDSALLRQAELLQPALQVIPRRQPAILLTAFRLGLIAAEKDVTTRDPDPVGLGDCLLGKGHMSQTPNASGSHFKPSSSGGAM
jgi:hypothetical protein